MPANQIEGDRPRQAPWDRKSPGGRLDLRAIARARVHFEGDRPWFTESAFRVPPFQFDTLQDVSHVAGSRAEVLAERHLIH